MKSVNAVLTRMTGCKQAKLDFFIQLKTGLLRPGSPRFEIDGKKQLCRIHNCYGNIIEETIYFSWNDGNSRNIDQERILKTAEFIKDSTG